MATSWVTPAELRMALLVALGIYPLDIGGFATSDVMGAGDARSALTRLRTQVLGVPL